MNSTSDAVNIPEGLTCKNTFFDVPTIADEEDSLYVPPATCPLPTERWWSTSVGQSSESNTSPNPSPNPVSSEDIGPTPDWFTTPQLPGAARTAASSSLGGSGSRFDALLAEANREEEPEPTKEDEFNQPDLGFLLSGVQEQTTPGPSNLVGPTPDWFSTPSCLPGIPPVGAGAGLMSSGSRFDQLLAAEVMSDRDTQSSVDQTPTPGFEPATGIVGQTPDWFATPQLPGARSGGLGRFDRLLEQELSSPERDSGSTPPAVPSAAPPPAPTSASAPAAAREPAAAPACDPAPAPAAPCYSVPVAGPAGKGPLLGTAPEVAVNGTQSACGPLLTTSPPPRADAAADRGVGVVRPPSPRLLATGGYPAPPYYDVNGPPPFNGAAPGWPIMPPVMAVPAFDGAVAAAMAAVGTAPIMNIPPVSSAAPGSSRVLVNLATELGLPPGVAPATGTKARRRRGSKEAKDPDRSRDPNWWLPTSVVMDLGGLVKVAKT